MTQTLQSRFLAAARRVVDEGIEIEPLANGDFIATSASKAGIRYVVSMQGNLAATCGCPAGQQGDPVCKHRAAVYMHLGALSLEPPRVTTPHIDLDALMRALDGALGSLAYVHGHARLDHPEEAALMRALGNIRQAKAAVAA